jgi:hypothetical protein
MLKCPRWECHRRNLGTLAPEFKDFVRHQFANSLEDMTRLLLGGDPPPLDGTIHITGNGTLFHLWRHAPPHIDALFAVMYVYIIVLPKCFAP